MLNQLAQRDTSLTPEPLVISELQLNAEVHGWLFAVETQTLPAKNGKPFRKLRLRDKKGNEVTARQFDLPHSAVEHIAFQNIMAREWSSEFMHEMRAKPDLYSVYAEK
jgi:hypothetical protein